MRSVIYAILAIGLLSLGACNSDVEKRVTDLERRVAALESGNASAGNSSNQNIQVNPNNTQQSQRANQTPQQPKEKPDGPLPVMDFAEKTHDFGRITEGEVVTKVFTFKNTGEAPLIISNASSSCGCTVPSYTEEPIAPGEEGEIEVKYNSRGKRNQDNKVVRITANTWPATNNLTIKVFVEPKAQAATGSGPIKQ